MNATCEAPLQYLNAAPKRTLRVREFRLRGGFEGFQLLQEKRWWGWKTIDREEIPNHALISYACFGDSGGWVSKFAKIGTWDRDGIIRQR